MRFNIVHNYIFIIIDDINNYIHKSKPLVFLYVHRATRAMRVMNILDFRVA